MTAIDDFLSDIDKVCRKHGLSISHEDSHGGFKIVEYDESMRDWLNDGEDKDEKAVKLQELFTAMKEIGKEKATAITWINEKLNPPKGFEIRSSGDLSLPNIKKLLEDVASERAQPVQAVDQKGAA